MRALLAVALAAATVGLTAPQANATRCAGDFVTCTIRCIEAHLNGDLC